MLTKLDVISTTPMEVHPAEAHPTETVHRFRRTRVFPALRHRWQLLPFVSHLLSGRGTKNQRTNLLLLRNTIDSRLAFTRDPLVHARIYVGTVVVIRIHKGPPRVHHENELLITQASEAMQKHLCRTPSSYTQMLVVLFFLFYVYQKPRPMADPFLPIPKQ